MTEDSAAVSGQSRSKVEAQKTKEELNTEAQASPVTDAKSADLARVNREFQERAALKHARERGLPYVNIGKTPLNPDYLKLVEIEEARKSRIIPFFRVGKKVRIAVENPDNPETKNAIKTLTDKGYEMNISLASVTGIDDALNTYQKTQVYKRPEIIKGGDERAIETYEKEIAGMSELSAKLDTVTAEEGLNLLNVGAIKTNASDIHYEPAEGTIVVRFRIDGVLHKVFELKPATYEKIANQLKYESKVKLNVTTIPQDGRYTFTFNEKTIAVRVSSIPTPFGESFVCRYLVSADKPLSFEDLGFQGLALKKLQNACKISHGMILSTGPTGSGKTTTLYALLNKMNTPENKIVTLEDPVEYQVNGVTQSQIDEKRDYTFASGLRAILRQDPDIIMLGEIRDLKTAETAIQAALTGHVLLSTLHSNSAIEAIPRLVNMGLPPFMVAPALDTVLAQRLVRRVCPDCSTLEAITPGERKEFEEIINNLRNVNPGAAIDIPGKTPKVHGCDKCSQTGYKGRLVLSEVITINAELKGLILRSASLVDLIAAARKEGIVTMREDGFLKVAQGLTTLEEVYRVTNVEI